MTQSKKGCYLWILVALSVGRWGTLLLLLGLIQPAAGAAQEAAPAAKSQPPTDVTEWHAQQQGTLPPLPEGFRRERHGDVVWAFPEGATGVARELQKQFGEASATARAPFGLESLGPLTIRLGHNSAALRFLAPSKAPPPGYAVGVAYPARRLVLLSLKAPDRWSYPPLDRVLVHELAHVALYQAAGRTGLPRWFVEGLAVQQAGEHTLARIRTLAVAAATDDLLELDELSRRFPEAPHKVNVAYAQSADFVGYLMAQDDGLRFQALLQQLKEGTPFSAAVHQSFGQPLPVLAGAWRARAFERFRTFPLFFGGSIIWVVGSVLLVLAYLKRRRQHRRGVARMAQEEAEPREVVIRMVHPNTATRPSNRPEPGDFIVHPPPPRETDVPTVEYEGRNHTLH